MACTAQLKGCQLSDRHLQTEEMCPPGQGTWSIINLEKANAILQSSVWRSTWFWLLLSSSLGYLADSTCFFWNADNKGVSGGLSRTRTPQDKVVWKTIEYLRSSEDVRILDFALNSLSSCSPLEKASRCLSANRVRTVLEQNLNLFKFPDLNQHLKDLTVFAAEKKAH